MLIVNVSCRQWRLWHWVNMSVTLLMDHGHCKKHKHKNINYKQFIIEKISTLHMACFDAKTKEKDGKWVYGQWSCAHFTFMYLLFFNIFSLLHVSQDLINIHVCILIWLWYCLFPLTALPWPRIWLWYLWCEACGGYRPTIKQIIFPR